MEAIRNITCSVFGVVINNDLSDVIKKRLYLVGNLRLNVAGLLTLLAFLANLKRLNLRQWRMKLPLKGRCSIKMYTIVMTVDNNT